MLQKHEKDLAIKYNNIKLYVNKSVTYHLSPVVYHFMKENQSSIFKIENIYSNEFVSLFCNVFRGKSFQVTVKNLQFLIDLFQELQVAEYDFILDRIQEKITNSIDDSQQFQDLTLFYTLIKQLNDNNFIETVAKCEELINIKIDSSSIVNLLFNLFITRPSNIDIYLKFSLEFEDILKESMLSQLYLLLTVSSSCDIIYIAAKFIEYQIANSREILLFLKAFNNNFYLNLLSFILSPRKHSFRLKSQDELRILCLRGESQNNLIKIIQNDNISEFQHIASDPNFDVDCNRYFSNHDMFFEKIRMLHKKNLTCIEIAAFFGSIQIFKFLLLSNAQITQRLAKFAVAGGNDEIIHLCDQRKCDFTNCLKYALKYDHHELFDWLIDSKGCKLFDDPTIPIDKKVSIFLENSFFTVLPSPEIFQSMVNRFMNDEIIAVLIASIHRGFYTYVSIIAKFINCLDIDKIIVNYNVYSCAIKCGSVETYRLVKSNRKLRNFVNTISLKKNVNYSFNFYTSESNIYRMKVCKPCENSAQQDEDEDDEDYKEFTVPAINRQTCDESNSKTHNNESSKNDNDNNNENDNDNENKNDNYNENDKNKEKNDKNNNKNDNDNRNNKNDNDNSNNKNDDSSGTYDNDAVDDKNFSVSDKSGITHSEVGASNNYADPGDMDADYYTDYYYSGSELEEEYEGEDSAGVSYSPPSSITINDLTDLHIACFSGNAEAVDDILYENLNKNLNKLVNGYPTNYMIHDMRNYGSNFCCTPIHAATLSKSVESVFLLLATNECNLNAPGEKNMTPLHNAVINDSVEIFEMLYKWPGVDQKPRMFRQKLPFHLAAKFGSINVLKYIAEKTKNFDINETAAQGMTALHYACKYNQREIVSYLVQKPECNVNMKTEDDQLTALHFACQNSDIEIIKLLIGRKDIKLNEKDINDETPLIFAIRSKFVDVISFLINCDGIDLNTPSILLVACASSDIIYYESNDQINSEIVKILLTKKEINVNCRSKDKKMTPLHIAALNNNFETVKVLMSSENIIRKPHDVFFMNFLILYFFYFLNRFQFLIFYVELHQILHIIQIYPII